MPTVSTTSAAATVTAEQAHSNARELTKLPSYQVTNLPIHQFTNSPTHQLTNSPICPYTLDWYSPVSVLTRTLSPSFTNGGTWMTRPVSSVAGLTCALAVAPLIPGTVSLTTRSTVCGSSMPTGSTS